MRTKLDCANMEVFLLKRAKDRLSLAIRNKDKRICELEEHSKKIRELETKFLDLQQELSKGSYATSAIQYDWLPLPENLSRLDEEAEYIKPGQLDIEELSSESLPSELIEVTKTKLAKSLEHDYDLQDAADAVTSELKQQSPGIWVAAISGDSIYSSVADHSLCSLTLRFKIMDQVHYL